ncbi:hypothetical protein TSUD_280460 [Trifolium subterraneum]|uniref:Reverse transcriptase domain-containing protein n=1 Tax=Trifolium subterraneum TaxID=3900 RepID=A0A2Z6PB46_TRISU|nr:hypothetical protein TSUD_280460 [Trifolium subterraneum]
MYSEILACFVRGDRLITLGLHVKSSGVALDLIEEEFKVKDGSYLSTDGDVDNSYFGFTETGRLNGNKSPGPDGFNLNFFKACWPIVKHEVLAFLNEFHDSAHLPKAVTASFLTLVPKKDHPQGWLKWMRACIFESLMSILINGSPTDDFKVERGLRQGDPLSPFLFLIVAEGLAGLMKRTVEIGIPDGANPRRRETWKPVVEAMNKRLNTWNNRHLSFGGRLTLINSVFTSLPLYFFSFFKVPRCILKQLVKIQRSFLWGGGRENRKICRVKWDQICLPKEQGGLRVNNLDFFNVALLNKWKWRFLNDNDAIWADLLRFRYGHLHTLVMDGSPVPRGAKYSTWWKDIVSSCREAGSDGFQTNIRAVVGKGNNIGFWKFNWFGNQPFNELFPNLFAKEAHPYVMIAESQMEELDSNVLNAIRQLWRNDVPSKVLFFGWRLLLERLPTRVALNHRDGLERVIQQGLKAGIILVGSAIRNLVIFNEAVPNASSLVDEIKATSWAWEKMNDTTIDKEYDVGDWCFLSGRESDELDWSIG